MAISLCLVNWGMGRKFSPSIGAESALPGHVLRTFDWVRLKHVAKGLLPCDIFLYYSKIIIANVFTLKFSNYHDICFHQARAWYCYPLGAQLGCHCYMVTTSDHQEPSFISVVEKH